MTSRRVTTRIDVATRLVEEWTPDEAAQSWFYVAGYAPDVVIEVNERIMSIRELNRAAIDNLLGVDR